MGEFENWGVTDFDAATGLPTVPGGYFWRVVAPKGYSDYYDVCLCLKQVRRGFFGHTFTSLIGKQPVLRSKIGPDAIRNAACYALTNNHQILSHFQRRAPIRTDLIGDYPPKTLSETENN